MWTKKNLFFTGVIRNDGIQGLTVGFFFMLVV